MHTLSTWSEIHMSGREGGKEREWSRWDSVAWIWKKSRVQQGAEVGSHVNTGLGSDLHRSLNLSVLPFLHPLMCFVNIQLSSGVTQDVERIQPLASSVSVNKFYLAQHPWVTSMYFLNEVHHLRFPSSIHQGEWCKKGWKEIDTQLKVPRSCGRGHQGTLLVPDDLAASLW